MDIMTVEKLSSIANMDIIYWSVRSSSKRGDWVKVDHYISKLQVLLYYKKRIKRVYSNSKSRKDAFKR